MSDRILYTVVSKGGGVDGLDPSNKGGRVKYASLDRKDAEEHLDAYSELKVEVIEHFDERVAKLVAQLNPVDKLLLDYYYKLI